MDDVEELAGWGGTPRSAARVRRPGSMAELADEAGASAPTSLIARGLGRSYGDAAQNAGGTVVVTTGAAGIDLDAEDGTLRAEAGASIEQVHAATVPAGWFLPVIPGTRFVTMGGAVAADIHGKNHHHAGSFGRHVRRLRMALASGEVVEVGPDRDPQLFWATLGGLGLTGTVLDVDVRLVPIASSDLIVKSRRTSDLDATMAALAAADETHPYTVAWIDAAAAGPRSGRGIVEVGRFATADESNRRSYGPRGPLPAPLLPAGLVAAGARTLNRGWYGLGGLRRRRAVRPIDSFFHPLDGVGRWNRLYGRGGFVQWQMVVPLGAEATVAECVSAIGAGRAPAVLAVLKRFGAQGDGHLSFPLEGWTLAVDLPAHAPEVAAVLDRLDRRVVEAGGRIYLAKDSRADPALVPEMYPRLDEWRQVRARVDPDRRLCSDLGRRLGL